MFYLTILFLQDTISIDGAIRVLSDEFSIALLNPELPPYHEKAEKYSHMVCSYMIVVTIKFIFFYIISRFNSCFH